MKERVSSKVCSSPPLQEIHDGLFPFIYTHHASQLFDKHLSFLHQPQKYVTKLGIQKSLY